VTRLAHVVIPGLPHHVTQRGNPREPIFFEDGDQEIYRNLLAEQTRRASVARWAYCRMPNAVHLILIPETADGLGRAGGEAHRRYTNFINARGRWTGHLFQSRFSSVAMDEAHLVAAARYVSLNPVRAPLPARARDWPWSSVRAHLASRRSGPPSVFLGGEDLAAFVHAGLQVDMVRAAELAGVLVFDIAVGRQGVVGPAHAAPRRGDFSLGDGHGGLSSEGSKCNRRPLGRRREPVRMPQKRPGFKRRVNR